MVGLSQADDQSSEVHPGLRWMLAFKYLGYPAPLWSSHGQSQAGTVAQHVKSPPAVLAFHQNAVPSPSNAPGKAATNKPRAWATASHVGDPDGVPGSWLQPGAAPAAAVLCRVN